MTDWSTILTQACELRHTLHENPELTWKEEKTAALIRSQLDACEISWRPCAGLATVGTIGRHKPGRHIALRADMDALPVQEKTTLPYKSKTDGLMHACGHDGHMAVLWAAAVWLKANEDTLPGPVSFLFQPAEEGGHGAREMIADGALEGIDEIYGWHNWPAIPQGQAVCPDGPVMSGNGTFEITLTGKGGHASQPELCRDPVLAAAALTLNLQQIVSRRLPPQQAALLSVTSIDSASSPTIIPETSRLIGSIRMSQPELREIMNDLIERISHDTARTYGVSAETTISPRYGVTINHSEPAANFRAALKKEFGECWQMADLAMPVMASEDFSYFLNKIPGAYALVGMANEDRYHASCHSPSYEFNDEIIAPVARVLARLAGGPPPA